MNPAELAPPVKVKHPIGASVRVSSPGTAFHGRTGEVVELPGFPWRDHRRVIFDLPDGRQEPRAKLVDLEDLRTITRAARPLPVGQLSLFPP